jgi:hypothetical protein
VSLDRAALRLATVMAIANGYQAPFPTMAGPNVFDSRIDALEGVKMGDMAPMAIVFTDDDDGESLSGNNGGPPFRNMVSLIFELSIGMAGPLIGDDEQPLKDPRTGEDLVGLVPVATEPELELMLDLFEHQLLDLWRRPSTAWARRIELGGKHIVRIEAWRSARYVEREGHKRLAVRQVMAKVMLPQPADIEIAPAAPVEPSPVPEPLGSLLDEIIAGAGPYAPSAQAMQDLLIDHGTFGPIVLPPLTKVRLKEANLGGGNLTGDGPARPHGVAQATLPQD